MYVGSYIVRAAIYGFTLCRCACVFLACSCACGLREFMGWIGFHNSEDDYFSENRSETGVCWAHRYILFLQPINTAKAKLDHSVVLFSSLP